MTKKTSEQEIDAAAEPLFEAVARHIAGQPNVSERQRVMLHARRWIELRLDQIAKNHQLG